MTYRAWKKNKRMLGVQLMSNNGTSRKLNTYLDQEARNILDVHMKYINTVMDKANPTYSDAIRHMQNIIDKAGR